MRGAVLGLENLAAVGGLTPAHWHRVVAPFVAAYNAHADDDEATRAAVGALARSSALRPRRGRPRRPRPPRGPGHRRRWDPARRDAPA